MDDMKFWVEVVTQTAFPIVLIIFVAYYVGKYGMPKMAEAASKLVDDFRDEMRLEREFHSDNLKRLFDEQKSNTNRIEEKISTKGDQVIETIKDKCSERKLP